MQRVRVRFPGVLLSLRFRQQNGVNGLYNNIDEFFLRDCGDPFHTRASLIRVQTQELLPFLDQAAKVRCGEE
jgi:hypothetical protein